WHGVKMCLAVGGGKFPISTQMRAAVLESIAGFVELLKTIVERHDAGNFLAHLPTGFTAKQMCAPGMDRGRQFAQDFPLGARLADLPGNFRAEYDAPLGDGFRSAIVLFIPGL